MVNPYYPPQKLMNEMKASFEKLLTQYPSGMRVNSLLAAKNFGVLQEHIVVGNGAAELIHSLMSRLEGNVGFVRPTFEEYPNRSIGEKVCYYPDPRDFHYTADDIMSFFSCKDIDHLVLINPDNPTGNYIPKKEICRLAKWCEEKRIQFILDESFVDFAEEKDASMLEESILGQYPRMVVVKSISKSHGVPGVRLGVMASADVSLIAMVKRDVSIWNINSFGEFYLQIADKYKTDYQMSLRKLCNAREQFAKALSEIPEINVLPSQANYLMVELTNGITAREITKRLLVKHNFLVKDITGKIKGTDRQFIRIAVRSEAENNELVCALKQEFLR